MLGKVQEYPRLMAADKRALLRYIFALLCEDAGYGDREALGCSKLVAQAMKAAQH
ncbi:hypothetical protein [Agathobaculum massiliense]|uniref:hypothetical protein n=1 Tax=Agathobaculum massiliense TaxID=3014267 RepID=UPI00131C7CCE|nr:hypothetical protein [Agathobaculum massiliense]